MRLARPGVLLPLHPPWCIDSGARAQRLGAGPCHPHLPPGAERSGDSAAPASATRHELAADLPLTAVGVKLSLRALGPGHFGLVSLPRSASPRGICSPGAMEPAPGSDRRSPPGPGVPRPPPRGHAPSTAAPAPSPAPASSSVQPDEERQPRISESGQFSDGLEDRGELPPPRAPSPPPLGSHLSPVRGAQLGEQRPQSHLSGSVRARQPRLLGPPFQVPDPGGS